MDRTERSAAKCSVSAYGKPKLDEDIIEAPSLTGKTRAETGRNGSAKSTRVT